MSINSFTETTLIETNKSAAAAIFIGGVVSTIATGAAYAYRGEIGSLLQSCGSWGANTAGPAIQYAASSCLQGGCLFFANYGHMVGLAVASLVVLAFFDIAGHTLYNKFGDDRTTLTWSESLKEAISATSKHHNPVSALLRGAEADIKSPSVK